MTTNARVADDRARHVGVLASSSPQTSRQTDHVMASIADHVEAAGLVNRCRMTGIMVTVIDALIAAMTSRIDGDLFTLDRDFARIAELVPLRLLMPQDGGR